MTRLLAAGSVVVSGATGCQRTPVAQTDAPPPATAPLARPSAAAVTSAPATPASVDAPGPGRIEAIALQTGRRSTDASILVASALPAATRVLGSPARVHLVVEAVDQPGPGAAVVVVLGISWDGVTATTRRVAVPVLAGPPPQAGTPWELPGPAAREVADLAVDLPAIPDPSPTLRREALDALDRAGFDNVEITSLAPALDAWPIVATFTTAGPGGARQELTLWLRRHLDHLVVAGLPPDDRPHTEDPR